ncbi:MAG: MoaD/ThiS family protein [Gemmataceae bacterium]
MTITVHYMAQIREAAGVASETVQVSAPCTLERLLRHLAERHGPPFRQLVTGGESHPRPTLLFFLGDDQIRADTLAELPDNAVITIMSPIAGGEE